MYIKSIPADFKPIERHDGIFQEKVHDFFRAKVCGRLQKPVICPQCKAVFDHGRWRWGEAPVVSVQQVCPACYRISKNYPAGFVTLAGSKFLAKRDEIMHLVEKHEQQERLEHPLQRIMLVEPRIDSVLVTTTDIQLARGIGEAMHQAYQGKLEYHYHSAENLLRVRWRY